MCSHSKTVGDDYECAEDLSTVQYKCIICGYATDAPNSKDIGAVRGNTERFKNTTFHLWKCPQCHSIHSLDPTDYRDIYSDYPLNRRLLDVFARGTFRNLLRRLKFAGVKKTESILDYGCGSGLFIQYLQAQGYLKVTGYDPYIDEYANLPAHALFDCIIANDVIEHVPDPRSVVQDCINHLKSGGLFYIGTADSEGVEMGNLKQHVMRLHQPFHRIIITQETLVKLGCEAGLQLVKAYRRSYMDTLVPFSNYRFLDEYSKALDYNMDRALDPSSWTIMIRRPTLLFYAFFGYFIPSAFEPAVVLRKLL